MSAERHNGYPGSDTWTIPSPPPLPTELGVTGLETALIQAAQVVTALRDEAKLVLLDGNPEHEPVRDAWKIANAHFLAACKEYVDANR